MAIKKPAIYIGLLLFTLWPLVQMQLALRYGVSPWKLAGWGMYSTPRIDAVSFQLQARRRDRSDFETIPELPKELHLVAWHFLNSYRWLRKLSSPDRLAEEIFRARPELEQLRFVVKQPVVDHASAKIVMTESEYQYSR